MPTCNHIYLKQCVNAKNHRFYCLLYSILEESIGNVKIFDFRSLTDLNLLACPEQDFTNFAKYLSVSMHDRTFAATHSKN